MALFKKILKKELVDLAIELGVTVENSWNKGEIKEAITSMRAFSEELVESTIESMREEKERERQEAREERERQEAREERERQEAREEKERQEAQKEKERQEAREEKEKERERQEAREEKERERQYQLERMRVANESTIRTPTPQPQENSCRKQVPEIRKLIPKFNMEETDVSLFLTIFERQLRAVEVDEEMWASQLLAVLPLEVSQIILQESGENLPNYATAKRVLLDRYRLTPEAFRQKFVAHARKGTARWKDFAYELQGYLDGWLKGLKIETLEQLKELMIADQMKRKAGAEARNQFIDIWSETVSPWELAEKLDHFELVRPSTRKSNPSNRENWRTDRSSESTQKSGGSRDTEDQGNQERNGSHDNGGRQQAPPNNYQVSRYQNQDFDKRKPRQCFICKSETHLKYACPRKNEVRKDDTEECNHVELCGGSELGADLSLSPGKANGIDCSILRDSGSSIDLVSQKYVPKKCFTGRYVRIRQPLENETRRLPVARVKLEGKFGSILTEAAVFGKSLDRGRYIMGNRTATRIARNEKQNRTALGSNKRFRDEKAKPEPKPRGSGGPNKVSTRECGKPPGGSARAMRRRRRRKTRTKPIFTESPGSSNTPDMEPSCFKDSGGGPKRKP